MLVQMLSSPALAIRFAVSKSANAALRVFTKLGQRDDVLDETRAVHTHRR